LILPKRIGRYEIESLLGQGGMGAVYKARDPELDRPVAIKTVSPVLLAGEEHRREYLERFRREARSAGRLSHPNIVSVYDIGQDGDTIYFVMEYVPGVSLETILKENPVLPVAQAQAIAEQVAAGLEEAHRQGIVHRDVKPANVFIDERGRVKVGDFGIARMEGSELTQTGVGLGTPGYSAPELLRGGTASARSDVFALGVLAYRLFAGQRPFQGSLPETLAIDILETHPVPPRAVRGEVPQHVSDAILRAMAKAPEERTPSADAFLRELRAAGTDSSAPAGLAALSAPPRPGVALPMASGPPTVATVRVPEPRRSGIAWIGLALLALLLLAGALVAFAVFRGGDAEPDAATLPGEASPSPRARVSPSIRPSVRPPERPRAPEPTPRPAEAGTPPFAGDGREILREAGKKLEEILREERKRNDEKSREDGKKRRGKKKEKDDDG
jgi:hypothetical protein